MAHPELEAKLIDNPEDRDVLAVYADHLQSIGDPRGELIALQAAGKPYEAFVDEHKAALLGPLAEHTTTHDGQDDHAFAWSLGFIKSARLSYDSNSGGTVKLEELLEQLLRHPSAMLLQQLVVPMNMLDDGMYFGPVVEKLAELGAPALRSLRIGEFQHAGPGGIDNGYDYEMSWTSLGDASGLWHALPRLERMRLQVGLGGSSASSVAEIIGDFDVPNLRHLEVITGGMSADCLRSFANANAPELEHMDLWLGDENYGATGTAGELAALFAATRVPKLRHLGIMNSAIAETLIDPLVGSTLLLKLRELDLAHGTLGDEGAAALAANARAFKHLERINLEDNCLGSAGEAAIRAALPNAQLGAQKRDGHYVSLSE